MTVSTLSNRLAHPVQDLSIEGLAARWFMQSVEVVVSGAGVLCGEESLFRRVRGAWGRALMEKASAEALSGKPCPWSPPCALDVFFREQLREGGRGLPMPYAFEMDRHGDDLIVRLNLFGFATEWVAAAADALVMALRRGIDWRTQPGLARNRICSVTDRRIVTRSPEGRLEPDRPVELVLLTPLDDEAGRTLEKPSSLLASLGRRLDGLARWHDARLVEDWPALASAWDRIPIDTTMLRPLPVARVSRERKSYSRRAVMGSLHFPEGAGCASAMLDLGQLVGLGRGVTFGQGRNKVVPMGMFAGG